MSRQRFIAQRDNNIYVNSTIYNDTNSDIIVEYDTTFTSALLEDSGEYYMTVIRFDIPNTLPIFEFQDNTYNITLSYNNIDYTVPLVMQNYDINVPTSRNIYTFQQFIDIINVGFTSAFTTLKTANPGAPPTEAPFMVFNHESDIFSLYTEQLYDPVVAGGPTIEIFFNYDLYSFFYNSFKVENYGVNLASQKDYRFIISDEKNNIPVSPLGYYEMKQQITTLYHWFDFQRIIFTSSSLPIKPEFITTRRSDGSSIYQPIVTDFIPELGKDRSNFIYNPQGEYRLIDMNGHNSLMKFDFRVLYVNKNGDIRPLTIPPNYSISVKFLFTRKEEYQNKFLR